MGCDTFLCIDQIIIKWMTDRLLNEDIGAKLGTLTIPQVCEKRQKMHFGPQMEQSYSLLDSAYHLITAAAYHCPDGFKAIVDKARMWKGRLVHIRLRHDREKDLKIGTDEFFSGMARDEKFVPVITLVVYCGTEHRWDACTRYWILMMK